MTRRKNTAGIVLIVTSLAGFSGLWFWESIPHVWSVISLVAQLISASSYLFPFSEDIKSLNFLIPDIQSLENRIDKDYTFLAKYSNEEIIELVYSYREEILSLEQKYIDSSHFPFNDNCKQAAEIDKLATIQERFGAPQTIQ